MFWIGRWVNAALGDRAAHQSYTIESGASQFGKGEAPTKIFAKMRCTHRIFPSSP